MRRYQLYYYIESLTAVKGEIVQATGRDDAVRQGVALYGAKSGGATALNVNCQWCEDEPVGNAARWSDPTASATLPCPRCGAHPIKLSQEVPS